MNDFATSTDRHGISDAGCPGLARRAGAALAFGFAVVVRAVERAHHETRDIEDIAKLIVVVLLTTVVAAVSA